MDTATGKCKHGTVIDDCVVCRTYGGFVDTEVKTPWSKGAMRAARQLGQFHGLAAQTISRETHDQELRELLHDLTAMCLSRAICVESTIATQFGNCVRKAEALLSTLEGGI